MNQTLKRPSESAFVEGLIDSLNNDEQTARIIFSAAGDVVFANMAFLGASGKTLKYLQKKNALSFFVEYGQTSAPFDQKRNGIYKLSVSEKAKPQNFYFSWITGRDEKKYLVGSHLLDLNNPLEPDTNSKRLIDKKDITVTVESLSDKDASVFGAMGKSYQFVISPRGKILRANDAFTKDLKSFYKTNVPANFFSLFEESEVRKIKQHLTQGPEPATLCFQNTRAQRFWIQCTFEQQGNDIYVLARDVTSEKNDEHELRQREKQLTEAESIGRMGHWSWKIGQEHMQWSREIYRIFGLDDTKEAVTLKRINAMMHKEDMGRMTQVLQRAIIECNNYEMDFRIKRPDGDIRFVRCEGRCHIDESGDVTELYGIMQDMTERMLHEKRLREAKNAAERAYHAKSQFLANMSHELRTPLNAVIGFSEMMQSQVFGELNEKYLEYVEGIHSSGAHLLDLITDILDMSKIEAGKYDLNLEDMDLHKSIETALNMVKSRAADANVTIDVGCELEESLEITADRRAVLQMLLNLLSNAIKFTKPGGSVAISCAVKNAKVSVTVKDTGIGIPAHKLANITKPFEQVSSSYSRDHEGSGLGLAITKELAQMHKGALKITSKVGLGTTATITLPLESK